MDKILVKRTFSKDDVEKILLADEIFEISVEDDTKKSEFKIPATYPYKNICLRAIVNDVDAGMIIFEPFTRGVYVIHVNILNSFRKVFTDDICKEALSWMFKNTNAREILTHVPAYRTNVIKLTERHNFKCVGVYKEAFLKNKIYHDLLIFQMEKGKCQQQQ